MKQTPPVGQHPTRSEGMIDSGSSLPAPLPVSRREALRRAALLLGATLSAPTLAAVAAACDKPRTSKAPAPRALVPAQRELIATISDHIIPRTDTPGARDAGVPHFIETMLLEYYTPDEEQHLLAGLSDVDARAKAAHGREFLQCPPAQQRALLETLDREAYAPAAPPTAFRTMKELTLLGYYTSEPGATKELRHERVPGHYDGCIPLAKIGRAWAV